MTDMGTKTAEPDMLEKHAPLPWTRDGDRYYDANGNLTGWIAAKGATEEHNAQIAAAVLPGINHGRELVQALTVFRSLVKEGGVPRYTITPGAALNEFVEWTDELLAKARSSQTEGGAK